jgi:hypothetical protein
MLLKFINTDMYILSPCEFMLIIAYEYDTAGDHPVIQYTAAMSLERIL